MRRVWLIRAGDQADTIDAMRHAGQIGLRDDSPQFANDVHPGDLVVSPNAARGEVWLGVVTSAHRRDDAHPVVPGHVHVRDVDWLGWLDRDASWMRDQLKSLERPPVMYELPGRAWWWRQVDSRTFGTAPRPVRTQPATGSRRASSTRTATSRTPAAPRAARPSTSTRKPPVALVRCAGSCGFQWAPTSLVDGLCADCRAD